MKALPLAAASLAAAIASGSAMAQTPSTKMAPWVQTGDAAYPPPPNAPPPGAHYEWVFNYDRHGNYLGHWEIVRDR
jgi:hypothetical protein